MVFLVCVNIVLRRVWRPILGTYEIVEFLAAVVISFSLAHCAVQKGHVAVGMLVERFSKRTQAIIDIITEIVSISIFALVAWVSFTYATSKWQSGEVSLTLRMPFYPFIYAVCLGCVMMCLVLFVDLLKSISKVVKG
jgi:TRAP-type C4-dicarboxylate transport system permease small subunit